jgi:hypothetical protein
MKKKSFSFFLLDLFFFLFFSFLNEYQSTNKQRQTITQRAQYRTPPKENNLDRQLQEYIYT